MKQKKPKKKVEIEREYDHLDLGNAASATECTGLIMRPPATDEELESYLSIADFRAPNVISEKEKNK
ncbi:MAG: hypothetical protein IJF61_01970 [Clostridia bacterium]|nr:hypothetical protein [Clostridia bacterium]